MTLARIEQVRYFFNIFQFDEAVLGSVMTEVNQVLGEM